MKTIKAFAPATIANFNVGFDVLGLSLGNLGDTVELCFNGTDENKITAIHHGENLPKAIDRNCCSVVIRKMQEALNDFKGVDIIITKGFASGSGLGSSSASSAAAAFGYNKLIGSPYSDKDLVAFAAEGERVACGSAHFDNVAPSLLGGIVLVAGKQSAAILELPLLDNLYAISLFPKIEVNTADSRKILKDSVPLSIASQQIGLMGAFVASLYEKDIAGFSNSLKDLMIESQRSHLIPCYQEMRDTAQNNKALAFGISGSGPSVFAIAEGKENANMICTALENVFKGEAIEIQTYTNLLSIGNGARILN